VGAQVTNAPPASAGLLLLGVSDRSWGTVTLPLPLGFAGMPGCSLLCSAELIVALARIGPLLQADLMIPNELGLLGARFFNQALVSDAGANAAGLTASNGAAGRVGGR
jgi:hypothetical protein